MIFRTYFIVRIKVSAEKKIGLINFSLFKKAKQIDANWYQLKIVIHTVSNKILASGGVTLEQIKLKQFTSFVSVETATNNSSYVN